MAEAVSVEIQQELYASIEIETENTESQNEANTSSENKSQCERLVSALEIMINKPEPSFSLECRIKRIPDHLRKVNEEAYTPMIISIGPFHHFDKKLQLVEKFKVRYLKSVIARANINLENLVSTIWKMEERIYCCYAEELGMDRDDFLKVILVDAIFILELFLRSVNKSWESDDLLIADQMYFIIFDLLLLENQLPFFVLTTLFDLIYPELSNSSSLLDLTFKFFGYFNVQGIPSKNVKIEHFTDLIRIFQLPQLQSLPERRTGYEMFTLLYSATQLHEAGVKFQVNSNKCLLDITFELKNGVLKMPRLELYDQTEALVRNVMALEQFGHRNNICLTDYFIFMDSLINTIEDINLLCNRRILFNSLGDNKAAFSLVKKLFTNITLSDINSDFTIICRDLNEFYEKPFHRLKVTLSVTTLKNQYFNNPWRGAGTIAACLLLLLTLIQTITSILQVTRA